MEFRKMQRLTIVRYTVKPEFVSLDEQLTGALFDRVSSEALKGINYATFREQDGRSFVHVFANLAEDSQEILTDLPEFGAFAAGIKQRCDAAPEVARLSVETLHAYRSPAM